MVASKLLYSYVTYDVKSAPPLPLHMSIGTVVATIGRSASPYLSGARWGTVSADDDGYVNPNGLRFTPDGTHIVCACHGRVTVFR
jgi:hypothetical protein